MSEKVIPLHAHTIDVTDVHEHEIQIDCSGATPVNLRLHDFLDSFKDLPYHQELVDSGPRWWQDDTPLRNVFTSGVAVCDFIGTDADTVEHMSRQTALTKLVFDPELQRIDSPHKWLTRKKLGAGLLDIMYLEAQFHDIGECHPEVGDVSDKDGKTEVLEATERAHHQQILGEIFARTSQDLNCHPLVAEINSITFDGERKLSRIRRTVEVLGYLLTGNLMLRMAHTDEGARFHFAEEDVRHIDAKACNIVKRNYHKVEAARSEFVAIDDFMLRYTQDGFFKGMIERSLKEE